MALLAQVAWVTWDDGSWGHRAAAGSVSAVSIISGLFFYTFTYRKWGSFL
ncbi:unnamed protein product, partial [Discosporangium mesarthrocarpum]